MTCTSGILVDIFPKLEAAEVGKGKPKQGRFFSAFCAFNDCLKGVGGKFPADVQR